MRTTRSKTYESKGDASSSRSKQDSGIYEEDSESEFSSSDEDEGVKPKKSYYSNGVVSCAVCNKGFGGATDLRRHLLIHSDEKPHICEICYKSYRQEVNLRYHMVIAHTDVKEFVCRFCRKSFKLKSRLRLHLRVHIDEKPYCCTQCPKTFDKDTQLEEHIAKHNNGHTMQCEICSSKFATEKSLEEHMEIHKKGRNHICEACDQVFSSDKTLQDHVNSVHTKISKFECPICEKSIKGDLKEHMKVHAPPKIHACDVCDATFALKSQCRIHKRIHTGERPFQCRVCWQSYGHNNVLKLHIRKHTGEKPFKCVLCKDTEIGFSQLQHLKTHMRTIHNKTNAYACVGCKECFKVKFHLDNHMKNCEKVLAKADEMKVENDDDQEDEIDAELLSRLRYLVAVLLKKISSKKKLGQLGFERRLIDHVLIASLKLENRKCYSSKSINELDKMKLNIQELLEWIVPAEIMDGFKKECPSIESILEKIVTMYLKKVTTETN